MNFFEKTVYALYRWQMKEPQMYGLFHFLWIGILIAACTLICVFRKKISAKAIDITLIAWGATLIVLEAVKITLYSFHIDGDTVNWAFDWGRFPFQFCSSPLYVALPAGLLRKGKIKKTLLSFIATFSLFGGLISMAFPSGMFASFVFISIHTMVWHASMVAAGFMLYVTKTVETGFATLLKGFIIFIMLVLVALYLNIFLGHHTYFNMFYISPYEISPLEVFDLIYQKVPYPVFLLCYIVGFTIAATLILLSAKGIKLAVNRLQKNKRSA